MITLLIFLIWKVMDFWTLFLAEKTIPYLGFFPYPRELFDYGLPQLTQAFANFDGIHYLTIASRGYSNWEQAFFPLYPIFIRLLTFISKNGLVSGLIISNIGFLIGLYFIFFLFDKKNYYWLTIFLLAFPTSFFFGAVYTEGLFFLLLILVLYYLKKKNYFLVGLFSFFSALTRLVGVFLIIPIAFHFFEEYKKTKTKNFLKYFLNIKFISTLISPLIGLVIYCLYLWKTTGDPFFFLTSQPVFGANRSTHLILLPQVVWRYIKILITANHNFQYYISMFELTIFGLISIVLMFDLFKILKFNKKLKFEIDNYNRLGLSLFSIANIILPTLTGTFSSIPRYALFSLSFFLFLSEIKNKIIKIIILAVSVLLHILIISLFGQGYFVG